MNFSKEDLHLIDRIVNLLYNGGQYRTCTMPQIFKELGLQLHDRDISIIKHKTEDTGMVRIEMKGFFTAADVDAMYLTNDGIEILQQYGTYLNFFTSMGNEFKKELKRQRWKIRISLTDFLKHTTSIIAILSTITTTVLAITASFDKGEIRELKQQVKATTDTLQHLKAMYADSLHR